MPAPAAIPRPSALRRALRYSTIDGVASSPIGYLWLPGNFIVAALLVEMYHLPEASYGLIVSIPFWCNFLQILITPLLARYLPAKTITVWSGWANAAGWLALTLALPLLPRDVPAASTPIFFAFFFGFSLLASIFGVGWNSWTQEWAPARIRGKFFGWRNRLVQIAIMLFLALAWPLLNFFPGSLYAIQFVFLVAIGFRVWALLAQQKIDVANSAASAPAALPAPEQLRLILRSRSLLLFIAFNAVWGFAANCFGPFYTVFMYKQLALSPAKVCLFLILNSLAAAASFPTWGRFLDRYGNKSVMAAALILWQLQFLAWCFIDGDNAWMLYVFWIWAGFASPGFNLGLFSLLLKLIPPEAKTTAIGLHVALSSLITAVAPILGGAIITWALQTGLDPFTTYHRVFLVQPALALLGCLLLLRIKEPLASPLSDVFGAMRNIRTISAMLGITFLVNYVFVKPEKKPER
ncbi:MAG: MFS transporter [Opitutae bacterium]|nr:MFS transporter [Opitutae bacterium]